MKNTKKSLYIPEAKYAILKGFASNRNISMNSLIIEALDKMYGLELFANPKFIALQTKETKKKL